MSPLRNTVAGHWSTGAPRRPMTHDEVLDLTKVLKPTIALAIARQHFLGQVDRGPQVLLA